MCRQGMLELDRGSDGVRRSAKDHEKAVTLAVDFTAIVLLDHRVHQPAMCLQHRSVVIAKPIDQAGGTLDVREQEGDRPAR
jgi:hypothetical protein